MKTLLRALTDIGLNFHHLNKELGASVPEPEEHLFLIDVEQYLQRPVVDMEWEMKARHKALEDFRCQEQELYECLRQEFSVFERKEFIKEQIVKTKQE